MIEQAYSTAEIADEIGVSKKTLLRWLQAGKLAEPTAARFSAAQSRVWFADDLERARLFREANYRKRL